MESSEELLGDSIDNPRKGLQQAPCFKELLRPLDQAIHDVELKVSLAMAHLLALRFERALYRSAGLPQSGASRSVVDDVLVHEPERETGGALFSHVLKIHLGVELLPRGNQSFVIESGLRSRNIVSNDPPGAGKTFFGDSKFDQKIHDFGFLYGIFYLLIYLATLARIAPA